MSSSVRSYLAKRPCSRSLFLLTAGLGSFYSDRAFIHFPISPFTLFSPSTHLSILQMFIEMLLYAKPSTKHIVSCSETCKVYLWREKTLVSPLDYKEIKQVNPKGKQSWVFIGRPDAEAEAPILCPPDAKNWLTGKDPDAGKDWRQEEKGMTEDEMVGWHHRTWWTWVWASSGSWWWTGKPGVL